MPYGYKRAVSLSFEQTVARVRETLAAEGFGIITEIDVKATLKKKLDIDYHDYIILGACNPKLAHQALSIEQDLGVLLPCNVVVYRKGEEIVIAGQLPTQVLGLLKNPQLQPIAQEVEARLKSAIDAV